MNGSQKRHRQGATPALRLVGWLGVLAMLAIAILGPTAGSIAAAGPGSDDNLPNSGHTSNTGGVVPTMIKDAVMTCDSNSSVQAISGEFTLDGTAGAGTYVIIYLTPNNGSDASPVGNVENNEVKVDISGKSGTVNFNLSISSPFTTTKGGVLAVFAKDIDGTIFTSKSNSLNCTEAVATPTEPVATPTEPVATPTEPVATPTEPVATPTEPVATPTEPVATPTEPVATPTEPVATPTEPVATPTEPVATPTEVAATPTQPPTGGVEAATGTPRVTLPPTDTVGEQQQGTGSWRLLLVVMAGLLAGILVLTPSRARR